MLDQVLSFFNIVPDFDLNVMHSDQQLNTITARIIDKLHEVLKTLNPDLVIVHGDTNTSFAAALTAFYNKIPIAHIEAGMRTGNLALPFPEEANRILTSKIANYHFAPTNLNVNNLLKERIAKKNIIKTGNTVIDSLKYTAKIVTGFSDRVKDKKLLAAVKQKNQIILVTGHRRENFGKGFKEICTALKNIATEFRNVNIIYPVHLNPNVKETVVALLNGYENIILTEPLSYPDFVYLMKKSKLILTDSGGIQEEGPSLGKPVLVMRDITERPEALKAGTVKLVGTNNKKIENAVKQLLTDKKLYNKMSQTHNPYGDGKSSKRILLWILKNSPNIIKSKPE